MSAHDAPWLQIEMPSFKRLGPPRRLRIGREVPGPRVRAGDDDEPGAGRPRRRRGGRDQLAAAEASAVTPSTACSSRWASRSASSGMSTKSSTTLRSTGSRSALPVADASPSAREGSGGDDLHAARSARRVPSPAPTGPGRRSPGRPPHGPAATSRRPRSAIRRRPARTRPRSREGPRWCRPRRRCRRSPRAPASLPRSRSGRRGRRAAAPSRRARARAGARRRRRRAPPRRSARPAGGSRRASTGSRPAARRPSPGTPSARAA